MSIPFKKASSLSIEQKLAEGWEYVSVPERNPIFTKEMHPTIYINDMGFQPGRKYLVPPEIAVTINERIKVFGAAQLRIMQPDADHSAMQALDGNGRMDPRSYNPKGEVFAVA